MRTQHRIIIAALLVGACGGADVATPPDPPATPEPAIPAGPYTPGTSYFGRNGYIEYIAGNLPVIFSAAHGGALTPAEIVDRTAAICGGVATTVTDLNTQELTRAIRTAFHERTGKYPHIVINRLHRRKLDANRDVLEAACGDAEARVAWTEFHEFLDIARRSVLAEHGKGWYTDIHGHGHAIQRLELGYVLSANELRLDDAELNNSVTYERKSSIRTFSEQQTMSFAALLRGGTALGTLLVAAGYPSVPSAQDAAPGEGEPYFSGGYHTARYGCSGGGNMCGVQIEHHYAGVRDNATNRANYAATLARVYETYLSQNFGLSLK